MSNKLFVERSLGPTSKLLDRYVTTYWCWISSDPGETAIIEISARWKAGNYMEIIHIIIVKIYVIKNKWDLDTM